MNNKIIVEQIQFKRGLKADLIAVLRDDNKPKMGEPVLEIDTHRLKFGNGIDDYEDLEYFNTTTKIDFSIHDPVTNEILFYDVTTGAWTNKRLADNASLAYIKDVGLSIWGYGGAPVGSVPVKNADDKISWEDYLTSDKLTAYEQSALQAANTALAAKQSAESSRLLAEQAARDTELVKVAAIQEVENTVNSKFWWGTQQEYNKIVSSGQLKEGTIYFVQY